MAQSTIVQVTVDYIGTTPMGGVARGLEVQNFAGPVKVGTLGTIIRYVDGGAYSIKQNEPASTTTYTVQESLAAIALVAEGMVVLTVERFGKTYDIGTILPVAEQMLFDVNKFAGEAKANGTGCEFYYRESGASDPIYYKVSETLAAIISAVPVGPPGQLTGVLTAPNIPYATGAGTLADSTIYYTLADSTMRLGAGSSIGSQVIGESMINFGAGGNEFNVSTDNGALAEGHIALSTAIATLAFAGDDISVAAAAMSLNHATEVQINSLRTKWMTGAVLMSAGANLTEINFGAGDDEFNVSTDGAAASESGLSIIPTQALLYTVDGTVNITATEASVQHTLEVLLSAPLVRATGNLVAESDVDITTAGKGLKIQEGANAKMGVATLVAGTLVVATTAVTANSRIYLTTNTPGGSPGWLQVSARVASTSFTILSSDAGDTSVVAWLIVEPS